MMAHSLGLTKDTEAKENLHLLSEVGAPRAHAHPPSAVQKLAGQDIGVMLTNTPPQALLA